MSECKVIFKKSMLSEKELFDFVELHGGNKITYESCCKGIIENKDATLWIYYSSEINSEFYKEELEVLKKRNFMPKVIITIEITGDGDRSKMAFDFCSNFMERYRDTIVDDSRGRYYRYEEIIKMECAEDGSWRERRYIDKSF